jgi:hypothetical protein
MGVALAGASSLSLTTGSAQAATVFCTFQTGSCTGTAVNGRTVSALGKPTRGDGIVDFESAGKTSVVDIDFDPADENTTTSPVVGLFEYVINTVEHNAFHEIFLNWNPLGTGSTATKAVYKAAGFQPGDLLGTITTQNGKLDLSAIAQQNNTSYSHLWIRDTWFLNPGDRIDNITNTFVETTVPGPLPLLGAGAAFGFSRRLRRRCKQSYSLG